MALNVQFQFEYDDNDTRYIYYMSHGGTLRRANRVKVGNASYVLLPGKLATKLLYKVKCVGVGFRGFRYYQDPMLYWESKQRQKSRAAAAEAEADDDAKITHTHRFLLDESRDKFISSSIVRTWRLERLDTLSVLRNQGNSE